MKQFIAGLVLASGTLMAQTPAAAPSKICVINLQSAMVSTKEGQAAAETFRTKFSEPKEKELQAKQAEINELTEKLQRGANTMSQTAQDDMKRTIDRKSTDYKRGVEDYQFDREEEQRKLLDDLSSKMQSVIARYAQENGCAVFLDVTNPNSGIMWISDTADVTRQIVEAYDKAQPSAGAPASRPASTVKPPTSTPAKPPATTPAKPPAATPGKQ
ncbi:MAG TPA: OmpH family outer membrane protein [Bryobacteraceae bacterium]|nr:OmpH family outer membrane protein [Bryobacteraceae bacterium]